MSREVDPNTMDICVAVSLLYSRLPELDETKFFEIIQLCHAKQYTHNAKQTFQMLSDVTASLAETSWKFVLISTTNELLETSFREGMYTEGERIPDDDPDDLTGRN